MAKFAFGLYFSSASSHLSPTFIYIPQYILLIISDYDVSSNGIAWPLKEQNENERIYGERRDDGYMLLLRALKSLLSELAFYCFFRNLGCISFSRRVGLRTNSRKHRLTVLKSGNCHFFFQISCTLLKIFALLKI